MPSRGDKNQRKEAKDKRQLKRKQDQQQRSRAVLNRVLAALGLTDIFSRLPQRIRDQAINWRSPTPQVVIEAISPSHEDLEKAKAQLDEMLSEWKVSLENGCSLTLNDYFTHGVGFYLSTQRIKSPREKDDIDKLIDQLRSTTYTLIHNSLEHALGTLVSKSDLLMVRYSRVDKHFIGPTIILGDHQSRGKYVRIGLRLYPIEEKHVVVNGIPRRAYRCGAAFKNAIELVSWKSDAVGVEGPVREIPVYLQSHALDEFRKRVTIEQDDGWVEDFVWQSLRSPVLTRGRNCFLAEYRFSQYKLGYFVVDFVDDVAVMRTFLFLTMDGTPEGDRLSRLLRVMKPDKKYLGLDTLNVFLASDVKKDSALVAAFEKCGCGQLLTMTKKDFMFEAMEGRAAEIKRYFGKRLSRALGPKT